MVTHSRSSRSDMTMDRVFCWIVELPCRLLVPPPKIGDCDSPGLADTGNSISPSGCGAPGGRQATIFPRSQWLGVSYESNRSHPHAPPFLRACPLLLSTQPETCHANRAHRANLFRTRTRGNPDGLPIDDLPIDPPDARR
jgi:hypothetical protein